jgi:hypothetical protein
MNLGMSWVFHKMVPFSSGFAHQGTYLITYLLKPYTHTRPTLVRILAFSLG